MSEQDSITRDEAVAVQGTLLEIVQTLSKSIEGLLESATILANRTTDLAMRVSRLEGIEDGRETAKSSVENNSANM